LRDAIGKAAIEGDVRVLSHTTSRSSSRLTIWPPFDSSNASAFAGCGSSATARPFLYSSPLSAPNSNVPNL